MILEVHHFIGKAFIVIASKFIETAAVLQIFVSTKVNLKLLLAVLSSIGRFYSLQIAVRKAPSSVPTKENA